MKKISKETNEKALELYNKYTPRTIIKSFFLKRYFQNFNLQMNGWLHLKKEII